MSADRSGYAAKQAALLEALLRGGELPAGFAANADAASRSLRRKRVGAVRHAWPALTVVLGASFDERFDAFARSLLPGDALARPLLAPPGLPPLRRTPRRAEIRSRYRRRRGAQA